MQYQHNPFMKHRSLLQSSVFSFSEFFREIDKKSVMTMNHEFYVNKEYKRIMD
jgi:hypothetical protein